MSHRGERPFVCSQPECGLAFVTSTHLKRHLKVHEKPKPFEVSLISLFFFFLLSCSWSLCLFAFVSFCLMLNIVVVENCCCFCLQCTEPGCGMSFAKHLQLKKHLSLHTGIHAFQCEVIGCGASFKTSTHLKQHAVKHSGKEDIALLKPRINRK